MGKATFILVIGSIVLFSIYVVNMNTYIMRGSEVMSDRYSEIQAEQMAHSMVHMLLSELADSSSYRTTETQKTELVDGYAEFSVTDTSLISPDTLIMIDVTAYFGNRSYSVKAFTSTPEGWVPPSVRGAWTANADLNNTISDMFIDGRDYRLDGTISPGTGNLAVSSGSNFTNIDRAEIGGTYLGVDYPTTSDENIWKNLIEQHVDWGGTFPTTPDEILGYPEGTLISIAKSGVNGSQYVLNPGDKIDEGDLNFPLRGVTYVDMQNAQEAKFRFPATPAGVADEGILILHEKNGLSRVKEIAREKGAPPNPFVGLLVADYSFHHHIDIIGAVLQLSDKLESEKNCNGNADHYVHYSSEAIINATEFVAEESGQMGNNQVGGQIGMGRKKALFWYE